MPKQKNQPTPFYKKNKDRHSKNRKVWRIKRAKEHQENLRRQSEQATTIPSVVSPSYNNINNELIEPSYQPVDDPPTYSRANVGRVVLSQFTEFRCLRGHLHIDQEDLDGCYKKFIKKYGNDVDKFMDIYSCNRLEAEDFILKYTWHPMMLRINRVNFDDNREVEKLEELVKKYEVKGIVQRCDFDCFCDYEEFD
ncbi:hypothetical protein GLOIN_2v1549198 [Rhizophagus irregularis DAOM 181602=DAOM 197198]|nr:hypothetical protein GLOIN_2v1549198 [Rhizophagus irregularis DAOM 181602=DAOM 197198]CAG8701197.1 18281_t:CDS:2 [Rhizophagus irregularis]